MADLICSDLFGHPVCRSFGQPGRPRHVPSRAQRYHVCVLVEQGCDQAAIAAALGITGPTLRMNYPIELGSKSRTGARRTKGDRVR